MDDADRLRVFWMACVPARVFLVLLAKHFGPDYPLATASLSLLLAGGFLWQWMRQKPSAFGGNVFWSRPLHAALFVCFAYLVYQKSKRAYLILLLDVLVGIVGVYVNRMQT